jgi:hypothetical protein
MGEREEITVKRTRKNVLDSSSEDADSFIQPAKRGNTEMTFTADVSTEEVLGRLSMGIGEIEPLDDVVAAATAIVQHATRSHGALIRLVNIPIEDKYNLSQDLNSISRLGGLLGHLFHKKIMDYEKRISELTGEQKSRNPVSRSASSQIRTSAEGELFPALKRARGQAPSFAAVLRGEGGETAAQVMAKLKGKCQPGKLGIRVDSVRQGAGGRIVVQCRDKMSLDKLSKNIAETCSGINVSSPEPLRAIIALNGVEEGECNEGLLERILAQNPILDKLMDESGRMKEDCMKVVRCLRLASKKEQRRVLLSVNGEARKILNEIGHVYVGFRRIRVVDNTPLLQCFKCLGFGHTTKVCKNEKERCMNCAGEHDTRKCQVKEDKDKHVCFNCKTYMRGVDSNHRASSWECPFYKRMQINTERRTVGFAAGSTQLRRDG